jgi:hypothetical protein
MSSNGPPRPRRNYQPVSASEQTDESQDNNTNTHPNDDEIAMSRSGPGRRRPYQSVASQEEEEDDGADAETMTDVDLGTAAASSSRATKLPKKKAASTSSSSSSPAVATPTYNVTILDGYQTKFSVAAHSSWTVGQFKAAGSKIHQVSPLGQRLIFQGKLLSDDQTLQAAGIHTDGVIVHLFPKPRVIVESANSSASCQDDDDSSDAAAAPSARVPTIILNADEAEQRSQILVLGSTEYMEAQSNIKLFSFMLLMISTMELLNLLALWMGVPQDQTEAGLPMEIDDVFVGRNDDLFMPHHPAMSNTSNSSNSSNPMSNHTTTTPHNYNNDPNQYLLQQEDWGWINTTDLLLSLLGVYVAVIGIRAANETRLALARTYLLGTCVVGVCWMLFNYYLTVLMDQAIEEERDEQRQQHHQNDTNYHDDSMLPPSMSNEEIYKSALSVMVLPGLVWVMCCLRAFQFHQLLHDAELEATTRIQSQLQLEEEEGDDDGEEADDDDHRAGDADDEEAAAADRPRHLPAVV